MKGITLMDAYRQIEEEVAKKYGKTTMTRKAVGDFMLADDHAVNVKSNNVNKQNYSPNMISIKKMFKWVFENKNKLSFIFVDYEEKNGKLQILRQSDLIPIEKISWECLSIEAQGYGVIQKIGDLKIINEQTKHEFYQGFSDAYCKYLNKEQKKHLNFSKKIKDFKDFE